MSRLDLPTDEITRAAMWLADIARWPDDPAGLLVSRFGLKSWQARKAVDRARKMQLYRRVHG
jgi:hypothetical protein